MLSGLYGWINTIVVTIIFAALVEMLMPSNSMKKYIKLVLGLLIMAVVLQPILSYFNKGFSLSGYSFKYENILDSGYIKQESEAYSQKQQDSVTKLYKENLQDKMKSGIQALVTGKNVSVSVEIIDDVNARNYGEIKKVTVTLTDTIKKVEKVGKVEVSGSEQKNTGKADENFSDLKKKIASLYDIDQSIIEIKNGN